jgi:hypothetical protein
MHSWWRTRYRLSDGDGVVMSYSSGEKGRRAGIKSRVPEKSQNKTVIYLQLTTTLFYFG